MGCSRCVFLFKPTLEFIAELLDLSKINANQLNPGMLVGKCIPNLIAKAFKVSCECTQNIYSQASSLCMDNNYKNKTIGPVLTTVNNLLISFSLSCSPTSSHCLCIGLKLKTFSLPASPWNFWWSMAHHLLSLAWLVRCWGWEGQWVDQTPLDMLLPSSMHLILIWMFLMNCASSSLAGHFQTWTLLGILPP